MALTDLGNVIRAFIEEAELAPKASRSLIRNLLELLETFGERGDEEVLREWARSIRAKSAFDAFWREVMGSREALAKTVYAVAHLGMPVGTARKLYGTKKTEFAETVRLAKVLGRRLGAGSAKLKADDTPWLADLLQGRQRITLVVTQAALQDLLFVAAEGYRVPKHRAAGRKPGRPKAKFTEVYGLCFGTVNQRLQETRWKVREVYYTVERCVPQLRALMRANSVDWNSESIKVQHDIASKLSPQWQLLGDFHSHPYRGLAELRAAPGWEFSAADQRVNRGFMAEVKALGHQPVVGLVIAVAKKGKSVSAGDPHGHGPHTMRYTLGPFEYVLGGWVNPTDHTYRKVDELRCHGIEA